MNRSLRLGLLLGMLNAAVAVAALAVVEALTPQQFGWFAYAPLDDVVVDDPRFPWSYVAVPLSLILADVMAVGIYLRRGVAAGRQD